MKDWIFYEDETPEPIIPQVLLSDLEHHLYSYGYDDVVDDMLESLKPIDITNSPDFCVEADTEYNEMLKNYKLNLVD